jgi:hypothetical protein
MPNWSLGSSDTKMASKPKSLFRYRTISPYSLAELAEQTIWYATPASFNDPFDCALTIDQHKFEESFHHALNVAIERGMIPPNLPESKRIPTHEDKKLFQELREGVHRATENIGLCCFSEDPRSILMWAHYANNHRGFCVEYSLARNTMLANEVSPVIYTQNMPSLSFADLSPKNSRRTIERLWRTKAACWQYEKEWRALAPEGGRTYPQRSPVLAVVFGQRMSPEDRQLVQQALLRHGPISFKEAYMHEDKFEICIRPSPSNQKHG